MKTSYFLGLTCNSICSCLLYYYSLVILGSTWTSYDLFSRPKQSANGYSIIPMGLHMTEKFPFYLFYIILHVCFYIQCLEDTEKRWWTEMHLYILVMDTETGLCYSSLHLCSWMHFSSLYYLWTQRGWTL